MSWRKLRKIQRKLLENQGICWDQKSGNHINTKRGIHLGLKYRVDVIQLLEEGYQWPHKMD